MPLSQIDRTARVMRHANSVGLQVARAHEDEHEFVCALFYGFLIAESPIPDDRQAHQSPAPAADQEPRV